VIPDYPRILRAGRRWLAAAALLFVIGIAAGYVFAFTHPTLALAEVQPALARLREIGGRVAASRSPVERALLIYVNNLTAVCAMVAGGVLAGVVPALALFFNGVIAGLVMGLAGRLSPNGASPLLLALSIVPHGIFELPAVWLGGAWGMRLGLRWLATDAAGQRMKVFERSAIEAIQVFVLSAVLLLVAAFVEGNVTLALVRAARA
jgi:stage II sporulation protein M